MNNRQRKAIRLMKKYERLAAIDIDFNVAYRLMLKFNCYYDPYQNEFIDNYENLLKLVSGKTILLYGKYDDETILIDKADTFSCIITYIKDDKMRSKILPYHSITSEFKILNKIVHALEWY